MLPDLESVRCFEAAARLLNFRAASSSVGLSPAAFSERLRRLEDDLGEALFVRTTRHVRLTPSGLRLLPQARQLLEDARRLVQSASLTATATPCELTLGTRFELGLSWLVPSLSGLRAEAPHRKLHLSFGNDADLLQRLRQGSIDALISSTRLSLTGLRYTLLHDEHYVFVATPAYLARRPLLSYADAPNHTLLDAHPDLPLFRYYLDSAPRLETWSFADHEYLGTIAAMRLRTLEGAGVAVLPLYFVQADLDAQTLAIICPHIEPQRDFFRLIWLDQHPLSAELLLLATALQAIPLR